MPFPNILDGAVIRTMRHALADPAQLLPGGRGSSVYPGASRSGTRTDTTYFPLDSRAESRPADRIEILKKSRYLRGASGIGRALFEKPVKFVCPGGLTPNAATKDEEYNERADEYFERHAEVPIDVTRTYDFYSATEMIATETPCDGELYAIKIRGVTGRCQAQFIRAHQCGDSGPSRDGFVDGILRDAVGAKLAYRFLQDADPHGRNTARTYSAEDVLHVFDSRRLTAGRPFPWIYHGANSALDTLDMKGLDMVSRKLNLMLAATIKRIGNARANFGPKVDPKMLADYIQGVGPAPASVPPSAPPTPVSAPGVSWEQLLRGGAIPVLGEGEELDVLDTDRSPINWIQAAEFLIREICTGYGISFEFLWSMAALGGATARFILEDLNAFCDQFRRMLIGRWCQPYRSWVIANGILHGELDEPREGHWWECAWSGPARVTVDRGRDGALFQKLIANGMMTLEEWWSLLGQDARRMRRKRIKEIKDDLAECEKQGVPYSLYIAPAPGTSAPGGVINIADAATPGTEAAKAFAAALKSGDPSILEALESIGFSRVAA